MAGPPTLRWFLMGLLAALPAALLFDARPARSQAAFETITTIAPPPVAREVPLRRGGLPLPWTTREEPAPGFDTTSGTLVPQPTPSPASSDDAAAAILRGPVGEVPVHANAVDVNEVAGDGPADGDRPAAAEPLAAEPLADGALADGALAEAVDGGDPTIDARPADERAAFETPPAGFDAEAVSIAVAPRYDRRPDRLFRFEPYQALGLRGASFVILPEVEVATVATSNVLKSTPARADRALEVTPGMRLVSNWSRHAVEAQARGTFRRYAETTSENAERYALELRGRLDVTRRTSIAALVSREQAQESRSAIDAGPLTAAAADITSDRAAVTLDHRFNRLALQLRGAIEATDYANPADGLGAVIVNDDRDRRRTSAAFRASWAFRPSFAVFAEVAGDRRRFDAPSPADGFTRDSDGERLRAGLSFGNTDTSLRGEASLGYGRHRPRATALADVTGLIVDANLAWRVDGLTTVMVTASSDIEETTSAGSAGALSRLAGVSVRHQFRHDLIATAGLTYRQLAYQGIDLDETEITADADIAYFVSREIAMFANYRHTALTSDNVARDYHDNTVRVGVRLAR